MKHHLEFGERAVETSHIWMEALLCYNDMAQFASNNPTTEMPGLLYSIWSRAQQGWRWGRRTGRVGQLSGMIWSVVTLPEDQHDCVRIKALPTGNCRNIRHEPALFFESIIHEYSHSEDVLPVVQDRDRVMKASSRSDASRSVSQAPIRVSCLKRCSDTVSYGYT